MYEFWLGPGKANFEHSGRSPWGRANFKLVPQICNYWVNLSQFLAPSVETAANEHNDRRQWILTYQ